MPLLTIRPASADDAPTLRRLAALDSQRALPLPALIAELDGEPAAAIELRGGRAVADPFRRTAEVVELLRVRQARLAA